MSALEQASPIVTTDPALAHFVGVSQEYAIPRSMVMRIVAAAFVQRRRNVWADASHLVKSLEHRPIVYGIENVPKTGPVVFLPNHYERRNAVWVGWGAMALTATIAHQRPDLAVRPIHWVMTDTWADCYIGPIHVSPSLLGWVLKAFGDVYGIIRMPAHDLANHDQQRVRSALSIRSMINALRNNECIAVHPEAGGFESLVHPPAGAGRVLTVLNNTATPTIPVGIYEQNDHLVVHFGEPIPPRSLRGLQDTEAADAVMHRIAGLVPYDTRGVYDGVIGG